MNRYKRKNADWLSIMEGRSFFYFVEKSRVYCEKKLKKANNKRKNVIKLTKRYVVYCYNAVNIYKI